MLDDKEIYCSNRFEELVALKGEKIKGIFLRCDGDTTHYCLVFESGWGFNWTNNGSFWIIDKDKVKKWLSATTNELEMKKQELSLLLEMAD
jgi:hypothetical protein